jgi:hypothetical protein
MFRILSLGAGVQSSTLALMAEHGDVSPFDAAIFADTQNEPKKVYEWLAWLKTQLSYPVYEVTAGDLGYDSITPRVSGKTGNIYNRKLIPAYFDNGNGGRGLLGRKCTAEYKVRALVKKQRELAKIPRGCKDIRVKVAIGISYDEVERMKPSQVPWAESHWPLVDLKMTRDDCFAWMAKHGFPTPPRSACRFCPFHSDAEWIRLRDEEPEEFAQAVAFDEQLRYVSSLATGSAQLKGDVYLHSTLKPLRDVVFKDVPSHAQVSQFGNECEGLCGV